MSKTRRARQTDIQPNLRAWLERYTGEIDRVLVIGNPEGLTNSVSDGIISALDRSDDWLGISHMIQITAPVSHGSSGSPVISEDGSLIGIAASFDREGQSLNFAVPAEYAFRLADLVGDWWKSEHHRHGEPLGGYEKKSDDPAAALLPLASQ